MLAEACATLAATHSQLIIAARQPEGIANSLNALPWVMDWRNQCATLSGLVPMPEFDLVVAWLHLDGLWLAEHLQSKVKPGGRFIHIHASAAEDPAVLAKRAVQPLDGITTQNVVLGRVEENGHKRWLNKAEVSAVVMGAIASPNEAA